MPFKSANRGWRLLNRYNKKNLKFLCTRILKPSKSLDLKVENYDDSPNREWEQTFLHFQESQVSGLRLHEFQAALSSLGYVYTGLEVRSVFDQLSYGQSVVLLDQFTKFMVFWNFTELYFYLFYHSLQLTCLDNTYP